MDEYVIAFVNDAGVYQELTFRGVSPTVASALASGLSRAPFENVRLMVRESREIQLGVDEVVPPTEMPPVEEPVDDEDA